MSSCAQMDTHFANLMSVMQLFKKNTVGLIHWLTECDPRALLVVLVHWIVGINWFQFGQNVSTWYQTKAIFVAFVLASALLKQLKAKPQTMPWLQFTTSHSLLAYLVSWLSWILWWYALAHIMQGSILSMVKIVNSAVATKKLSSS